MQEPHSQWPVVVSQIAFGTVVQFAGQVPLVLRHTAGAGPHSQHTGGFTQSQKFAESCTHCVPGVAHPPTQPFTAALNMQWIVDDVVLLLVLVVVVLVVGMPDLIAGVHSSSAFPNLSGNVPNWSCAAGSVGTDFGQAIL